MKASKQRKMMRAIVSNKALKNTEALRLQAMRKTVVLNSNQVSKRKNRQQMRSDTLNWSNLSFYCGSYNVLY